MQITPNKVIINNCCFCSWAHTVSCHGRRGWWEQDEDERRIGRGWHSSGLALESDSFPAMKGASLGSSLYPGDSQRCLLAEAHEALSFHRTLARIRGRLTLGSHLGCHL